jgi:putative peptidoglycan lipid II flippase
VLASIASVICNIFLNFILVQKYSYFGLALATSITMILNFVILFVFIKLRIRSIAVGKIASAFVKITAASLLMGAVLFYLYDGVFIHMRPIFLGFDTLFNLFCLSALIPFGVLMLFTFGERLKVEEVNTLAAVLRDKSKKIMNSAINLSKTE